MAGLQNSIYAPTPLAVAKGGTGNTTPLFSTGPLTVGTVGYRAPNGTSSTPAYSFTNSTGTGIGYSTVGSYMALSSNSFLVSRIYSDKNIGGNENIFTVIGNSDFNLGTNSLTNSAYLNYAGGGGLNFDVSGNVEVASNLTVTGTTTLTNPLITSNGGTGVSATPANGKIPIGNGTTAATWANLTGANGIAFTNGPGSIQINIPGQLSLPLGTVSAPAYSFSGDSNTGIYSPDANFLNICANGKDICAFYEDADNSYVTVSNTVGGHGLTLADNGTTDTGDIYYDGVKSISISQTGIVTLPAAPLPIGSGGTNATTQANAIKNIMPAATVNGTVAYYNGTNWVILAPPAAGTFFLKITSTGTGTGGTPFWSLV